MTRKTICKKLCRLAILMIASVIFTGTSFAAIVSKDIAAVRTSWTDPDGVPVTMWGFIDDPGDCNGPFPPWDLGPEIIFSAGDHLTINLRNCLTEPVSVVMTGQKMPVDSVSGQLLPPVFHQPFAPADSRPRMRSMTAETPPQGVGSYVWDNVSAGSAIYHSGTNIGKQVHMGLYGKAAFNDPFTGNAYPGVSHDWEIDLFYSEIDPALHDPLPAFANPNNYKPRYFLVNGEIFDNALPIASGAAGMNVLVRMFSTSFDDIVPTLLGADWKLIAEDGNLYPYPKTQYTALLPPLKTREALFNPEAEGLYAVFDRKLNLTNHMQSNGGFLAKLNVGATALLAKHDFYSTDEGLVINEPAAGVLTNDEGTGPATSAVLIDDIPVGEGSLTLNADGSFTYDPLTFTGQTSFTYQAEEVGNPASPSNIAVVTINVVPAPAQDPDAINDFYEILEGETLNVPAPGVLANDSPAGVTASILQLPNFSTAFVLNPDGSFSYASNQPAGTVDTFRYTAQNAQGSDVGVVYIEIISNPALGNTPPVAMDDFGQAPQRTGTILDYEPSALTLNVVANDTDEDGVIDPTTVNLPDTFGSIQTTRGGMVVNNFNGTLTYYPTRYFLGTDSFYYTVEDNDGNLSNRAMVIINVVRP